MREMRQHMVLAAPEVGDDQLSRVGAGQHASGLRRCTAWPGGSGLCTLQAETIGPVPRASQVGTGRTYVR
jgi:hypothetical protein